MSGRGIPVERFDPPDDEGGEPGSGDNEPKDDGDKDDGIPERTGPPPPPPRPGQDPDPPPRPPPMPTPHNPWPWEGEPHTPGYADDPEEAAWEKYGELLEEYEYERARWEKRQRNRRRQPK
jgi:hypothetical protein